MTAHDPGRWCRHKHDGGERATWSVEVMYGGEKLDGYERHEPSENAAIDAVADHIAFKVRHGALDPGTYRFIAGKTKRDVKLERESRGAL